MRNLIFVLTMFGTSFMCSASGGEHLTATIIGSGSPIHDENRASASVLISGPNSQILVDMGNGTQANLYKSGVDIRDLSALLFTHHHLDHNEEFVPILIRSLMGRHNFTVIGPPNTVTLTEATLELYAEDIAYRLGKTQRTLPDRRKAFSVRDIQGGQSFDIEGIRVSTLRVPHTIEAIAYRFDSNGESIVITGDLTFSRDLPDLAKDADIMIIDSGGMIMKGDQRNRSRRNGSRQGNKGSGQGREAGGGKRVSRERAHLSLQESSLLGRQAHVKTLVYTHFRSGEIDQEASLREIRKNYSGSVLFGEDLQVISSADQKPSAASRNRAGMYRIVDTDQTSFYGNDREIREPGPGDDFYGQDANHQGNDPSYTDNSDDTITDNITGLMWQKVMGDKMSFQEAFVRVQKLQLAGYADWRVPSIKELYSLIRFTGRVQGERAVEPFIDSDYFSQPLGDTGLGEREIDAQTWSSTEYVGKTMRNDATVFGVNFIDGRIKGYPKHNPRTGQPNKMYFRFVRGNPAYGANHFLDNGNGTITDDATGLMWQHSDSNQGMQWEAALKYAESLELGGYDDWRLPNAKELQSIVDYGRSVPTSDSAAINRVFATTEIKDPEGSQQYPYFWTSTTHLDGRNPYDSAVYFAFGTAQGIMRGRLMDVHGAGAQRSDPKAGNEEDYPQYFGPQGDVRYVFNYVRCVRSVDH